MNPEPQPKSNLFRFEKKFGWSELFAIVAIGISLWGLYEGRKSTSSSVQIVPHPPTPLYLGDQNHDALMAACFPLTISNRGGIGVSIVGIGNADDVQPVTATNDGNFISDPNFASRFFVSNVVPQKLTDNEGFTKSVKFLSEAERKREVIQIASGETKNITIGILVDAYDVWVPIAETLCVTLELEFDDGTSYPLRAAFSTRVAGKPMKGIHIEEPLKTFVPASDNAR